MTMLLLDLAAPQTLDAALGVTRADRWYGFYPKPQDNRSDEALMITTGQRCYGGQLLAWRVWLTHPESGLVLRPFDVGYGDGEALILVVDRETRALYVAPKSEAVAFLAEQPSGTCPAPEAVSPAEALEELRAELHAFGGVAS